MVEPQGPEQQGSNQSPEVDEANKRLAMQNEGGLRNMQANRYNGQGSNAFADSPISNSLSRFLTQPILIPQRHLHASRTGTGSLSSASEAEPAVIPEVDHEDFIDRNGSLYALAEHGRLVSQAAVSGDFHDNQLDLPFQGLQESLSDDSSTDEALDRPREGYRSRTPTLRASCYQQRPAGSRQASKSTSSAIKRPSSSRESTDEDPTDFPVDHDHQAEERPQVLRRSRRKTNKPLRYLPNPKPVPSLRNHRLVRSADAAGSRTSRDLPQVQHALIAFTKPAYGKITVEVEPLGPSQPISVTPQGRIFTHPTHPDPGFLPDMKRRRVMQAESHSSPSQPIPSKVASDVKSGYYYLMKSIGLVDFPWEVASDSNRSWHQKGRKVIRRFLTQPGFSPFAPAANSVFLSELIPKKYGPATREQFFWIFKWHAPYVPACVMEINAPGRDPVVWNVEESNLDRQDKPLRNFEHPLGSHGIGWPTNVVYCGEHPRALPVEIFLLIGQYLPRDSVQNMRLVNREFEKKISRFAFRSVVVPFKPKIYGAAMSAIDVKGKGKQKETISGEEQGLIERQAFEENYDPNESHVKDGMRVFEQWGPEIQKFALTFEVTEDTLKGLLPKKKYVVHNSFWGTYEWPPVHYSRFEHAATLEQKADETSVMTHAFSKLKGIQEFGLSVISGLGWQSGPDVSDRVKLFNAKPVVFGPQYNIPDQTFRNSLKEWEETVTEQTRASKEILLEASRFFFEVTREMSSSTLLPRVLLKSPAPKDWEIRPPIMFGKVNMESQEESAGDLNPDDAFHDDAFHDDAPVVNVPYPYRVARGNIRIRSTARPLPNFRGPALMLEADELLPNCLTVEQEEWLMEMEWAQGAFLSSWCIAVLDNPDVFHTLRTFTIANLSSGLLGSLQRDDIWCALQNLEKLTVLVLPDWRQVSKDEQGDVTTKRIEPSGAQYLFWAFLSDIFKTNQCIKTLKIGYVGGGEHAPGMYARNQNILPAPIMRFPRPRAGITIEDTLSLPNVEHLILSNCWLTPEVTKTFFSKMQATALKTVNFESVSLTADPNAVVDETSLGPDGMDAHAIATRRNKWLQHDPIFGSWSEVIHTITPGLGIAHARYAHGKLAEKPPPPGPTTLESITFNSCGYVRLKRMIQFHLNQHHIPELIAGPPECLRKRHQELEKLMLGNVEDDLLGAIVPCLTDEEEGCLKAVWGMDMG
ncbi:MAG: hypothetical protein Q9188_005100, partial [Gyalolechia gomerana]